MPRLAGSVGPLGTEPQLWADDIDEEYEEMGMRPFFDDEEELAQAV